MKPTLCLVESNRPPGNTAQLVQAAQDRGLEVLIATSDAASVADLCLTGIRTVTVDTCSAEAVADRLKDARDVHVAGVTTAHDFFTPVAAQAAALLGVPGPDPQGVATCRRKDHQRRALAEAGVSQPQFRVCHTASEAAEEATALGFPVVVKPVALADSIGVKLCATPAEVADHTYALLNSDQFATRRPVPGNPGDRVLVESLAQGREFAVEIFGGRFIGVTETTFGPPPGFVERQHILPPDLDDRAVQALGECAVAACAALSLRYGPVHVEVRLDEGVPRIIEVNPRLAGGQIPALYDLAQGLDLWDATVRAAVGDEPSVPDYRLPEHAAVLRHMRLSQRTVVNVRGALAGALPLTGEHYRIVVPHDGEVEVPPPTRTSASAGWVIADGSTVEDCEFVLDALWKRLGERLPMFDT
jgi:S-sulfo-L-cysteine synthase (3-phospho-L-serine-dependent)